MAKCTKLTKPNKIIIKRKIAPKTFLPEVGFILPILALRLAYDTFTKSFIDRKSRNGKLFLKLWKDILGAN